MIPSALDNLMNIAAHGSDAHFSHKDMPSDYRPVPSQVITQALAILSKFSEKVLQYLIWVNPTPDGRIMFEIEYECHYLAVTLAGVENKAEVYMVHQPLKGEDIGDTLMVGGSVEGLSSIIFAFINQLNLDLTLDEDKLKKLAELNNAYTDVQ